MGRDNVLPRRNRPTTNSYRSAVKSIVENVQAQHDLTDGELAERLGCSVGTVRNARNKTTNLDGVTLANVEYEFGPAALNPFLALGGSRAVPVTARCTVDDGDWRFGASECAALLAKMTSALADGTVSLAEKRTMLPEIAACRLRMDALHARVERAIAADENREVAA